MREHYNHSRRRVLRRRRIMVIAAAILLVAAVVFAVVHWVIPALNKEINPPDPGPAVTPGVDPVYPIRPGPVPSRTMILFITRHLTRWCRKASR